MCYNVFILSMYYHYQDPNKNWGTSCLIMLFIFANIWADIYFLSLIATLSDFFIFPNKQLLDLHIVLFHFYDTDNYILEYLR